MTRAKRGPKGNGSSRGSRQNPVASVIQLKGTEILTRQLGKTKQLMPPRPKPTLENPGPPPLPDIMLTQPDTRTNGLRSDPTSKIHFNVRILMKPGPRVEFSEPLNSHPLTQTGSTRAPLPRPRRESPRTETKPQDGRNQARDPHHIKVQIAPQEQSPNPGRGITNPARRDKGGSEEAMRHSPRRGARDPPEVSLGHGELTDTPQVIIKEEVTAGQQANDLFSIGQPSSFSRMQSTPSTSRDRPKDLDSRLNDTPFKEATGDDSHGRASSSNSSFGDILNQPDRLTPRLPSSKQTKQI